MLIIPVGQEHSEVRRQPWVSYGIVAINILVFAFLWLSSMHSDVPGRFEAKAKEVTEYLVRNPYLTVPPELGAFYGRRALQLLEQARENTSPPIEWVVRRQQQKLNTMARDLFAIGRELPLLKPGFVPASPDAFAALSSMFVHAGLLHLVGNMLFFFATGPFLEDVFGRVLFSLLYLLSGGAALAAHTWQNPGSLAPVIGASGAVAGIMGAFLVRLWASRIRFLFVPIILLPWFRFRLLLPAFAFLPLWFIGQFWLATNLPEPGAVALWAHVGGFAFGAVAALLILALGIEKRWIHPKIEARVAWNQNAGLVEALDAKGRGDVKAAQRRAVKVLREDPSNVDALRFACDLALEEQDWAGFGREASRLLELYVMRGENELATRLIGEASSVAMDALPLRFYQRAASFLDKQGEQAWASRFYRKIAESHARSDAALHALLRTAELAQKEGDARGARDALERASDHPECSGEWRSIVEKKLAALEVVRA
ncbi:MAG TPA: rhomboid family intramembrane serine protease [Thermoanaerobaculia bacterium]|jgi:membrane associated rhomboid family serine protease